MNKYTRLLGHADLPSWFQFQPYHPAHFLAHDAHTQILLKQKFSENEARAPRRRAQSPVARYKTVKSQSNICSANLN